MPGRIAQYILESTTKWMCSARIDGIVCRHINPIIEQECEECGKVRGAGDFALGDNNRVQGTFVEFNWVLYDGPGRGGRRGSRDSGRSRGRR